MISRVLLSTSAPPTSAVTPSRHRRTMPICPTKVAPTGVIVEPDPTLDGLGRHLREETMIGPSGGRRIGSPRGYAQGARFPPNCRSEHSADGVYGERALAVGCARATARQRLGGAGCDRRSLHAASGTRGQAAVAEFRLCTQHIATYRQSATGRPGANPRDTVAAMARSSLRDGLLAGRHAPRLSKASAGWRRRHENSSSSIIPSSPSGIVTWRIPRVELRERIELEHPVVCEPANGWSRANTLLPAIPRQGRKPLCQELGCGGSRRAWPCRFPGRGCWMAPIS
jgi:hypothetical protein